MAKSRPRRQLRERAREALKEARRVARDVPRPPKLSEEVRALADRFADRDITLGEMIEATRGRAWTLVIMLLALPFCTPIPLPFVSTPFGLAIALISLRLALGQKPWLPSRLLTKPVPGGFFRRVLQVSAKILGVMEKLLRPRWAWLTANPALNRLHAATMLAASIVLLLPIPIPFTNGIPACAILLMAGGLLERDGRAVVLSYALVAAGVVFFYFLGEQAVRLLQLMHEVLPAGGIGD